MKSAFLTGKNCYLRAHDQTDVLAWAAWFNDAAVTRYLEQGYYPNTPEHQTLRLQQIPANTANFQLAVVDVQTDALVGTVGLHGINLLSRNADISIIIGNRTFWGKRYGKEAVSLLVTHAFGKLNLHKLTAGMTEGNDASLKLFEDLGFKKEAHLIDQVFLEGRYHNQFRLALFSKVWHEAQLKK